MLFIFFRPSLACTGYDTPAAAFRYKDKERPVGLVQSRDDMTILLLVYKSLMARLPASELDSRGFKSRHRHIGLFLRTTSEGRNVTRIYAVHSETLRWNVNQ